MIHSSRAITLVLISAASILAGYHTFQPNYDDDRDQYFDPTTRPSGYSHSSHYYHSHYWGGGGYSGSSGGGFRSGSSGSMHGTSHGGFGGSGHAAGS
jgi:hypothetical protein